MKRLFSGITLLLTLCISLILCIPAFADSKQDEKRVLFLSSYSYGWDTVQIQIEGIKQSIGEDIVLDYEFMDTKRFPDEESLLMFYEGLKYRLEKLEPYDAVILGDDAALQFAMQYREDLFNGVPLIFEGINDIDYAIEVSRDPLITGVVEKLSFEKNINFALTLYPNATQVISILDDSVTGQAERESFYKNAQSFPELTFTEINTSELTTEELIQELSSIDENSILIYIVMTEDASGKKYTNLQSVKLVSEYASVPALRMVSGGIGDGLLGGNIVSMELSGKIAGTMATEIVNGKNPAVYDIILDSPNVYCIDEAVMRKYNLDLSLIPENAEIINHQPTFIERNVEALIPGTIILLLLVIIIILLYLKSIRQKQLTLSLQRNTQELEKSSLSDFLTEIPNRTKLYADLTELILHNSICSVFIFDIDGFKQINDTHGHAVGDEVLKEVGRRLNTVTDNDFTPYRLGGDEFVCILRNNFERQIENYANKCMELFKSDFQLNDLTLTIQISLGISVYPNDTNNMTSLLEYADQAMYAVKKKGKNSYEYYSKIKDNQ